MKRVPSTESPKPHPTMHCFNASPMRLICSALLARATHADNDPKPRAQLAFKGHLERAAGPELGSCPCEARPAAAAAAAAEAECASPAGAAAREWVSGRLLLEKRWGQPRWAFPRGRGAGSTRGGPRGRGSASHWSSGLAPAAPRVAAAASMGTGTASARQPAAVTAHLRGGQPRGRGSAVVPRGLRSGPVLGWAPSRPGPGQPVC